MRPANFLTKIQMTRGFSATQVLAASARRLVIHNSTHKNAMTPPKASQFNSVAIAVPACAAIALPGSASQLKPGSHCSSFSRSAAGVERRQIVLLWVGHDGEGTVLHVAERTMVVKTPFRGIHYDRTVGDFDRPYHSFGRSNLPSRRRRRFRQIESDRLTGRLEIARLACERLRDTSLTRGPSGSPKAWQLDEVRSVGGHPAARPTRPPARCHIPLRQEKWHVAG